MKKIKDYINKDKVAIHCSSKEEWDKIIDLFNHDGISISVSKTYWESQVNEGKSDTISIDGKGWSPKKHYESNNYTIYPASDFLSNTHPFEVGKWYKSSRWVNIKAAKFLKIKDNGKFSYSERINTNGYEKVEGSTDTDGGVWDTFSEVPIEQIQLYLLPKNEVMEEISMLPYPNYNYFKAIVIKDIHRENIPTKGNIPDFIPKGYKTWFTEIGGESWKDRILNKKSIVCPENNRWSTNIPSEYFEIVEESKSKFEEGKWYKYDNYIGKFAGEKDGLFTVSEYIHNNKFNDVKDYHNKWGKIDDYQKILLEDLSEIQEWLPDGHVDKIKIEVIPEYVECIKGTNTDNYNNLGKIYKVEYYNSYTGDIKILGKTISSIFFGEKSLIHRNNTDYKPSTKEAFDLQNKPKQPINEEELLIEEARKRYPIGTKFKCSENGTIDIVTKEKYEGFRYGYIAKDSIEAQGMYYVYYKGKWAEIIKVESNMKEIQEECMRMFPIGCKYISAGSSDYPRILEKDTFTYTIKNNNVYTHERGGLLYQGDIQQYAELISLPEEEEKGWIPQVGDWVVLISGEGKPNWSNSMETYVGRCVQLLKKQGDGKMYYLIQEDNKCYSWEYSERTKHFRKALPHEISGRKVNECGLYEGYILRAKVIRDWAGLDKNKWYNGSWKQSSGVFVGDRTILKIGEQGGKSAFLVSGTSDIWLKAEGFREFDAFYGNPQGKQSFEGKENFVNSSIEVQIYIPGDKKSITNNVNTVTSIQEQLIKPKQTIFF